MTVIGRDQPAAALLVEHGGGNPCFKLDVAAQVVAIHCVVQVGQDLRLGQVACGDVPFLAQFAVPGEAIDKRFTVG
ncbi:hypothetical protein D3C87_1566890 [compost metagenome]